MYDAEREFVLSVGSADRRGPIGEVRVKLDAAAAALVGPGVDLSRTLAQCAAGVGGGAVDVLHVYEVRPRTAPSQGETSYG